MFPRVLVLTTELKHNARFNIQLSEISSERLRRIIGTNGLKVHNTLHNENRIQLSK